MEKSLIRFNYMVNYIANYIIEKKNIFFFTLIIILFAKPSFSYIDPGTISIIISGLVSIIVTIGLYFSKIFYKIKSIIKKIFNKKTNSNS